MATSSTLKWQRAGVLGVLVLLLLVLAIGLSPREEAHAYGGSTEVRRIAQKLQCPVCEGTSVADSPSPVAEGMREKIKDMLAQGKSEKEILGFFRYVYGDFVLRDPPKTGFASILWWGPGAGVVVGLWLTYMLVWRHRRGRPGVVVGPESAGAALDLSEEEMERYRLRLRRELEDRAS